MSGAGAPPSAPATPSAAPAAPPPVTPPPSSLTDIVLTHFDRHQRRYVGGDGDSTLPLAARTPGTRTPVRGSGRTPARTPATYRNRTTRTPGGRRPSSRFSLGAVDAPRRCAMIRDEISTFLLAEAMSWVDLDGDGDGGGRIRPDPEAEVTAAVVRCADAALASAVSSGVTAAGMASAPWAESVDDAFDLVSCLGCACGNGTVARALVGRAAQFSKVDSDVARAQSCRLLGRCLHYLGTSSPPPARGAGRRKARGGDDLIAFLTGPGPGEDGDGDGDGDGVGGEVWRDGCSRSAAEALLPRLTDRVQAVRNAAIQACGSIYTAAGPPRTAGSSDNDGDAASSPHDVASPLDDVLDALLLRMKHDPSHANRSAAVFAVPATPKTVPYLLERVRDVKDRVRVDALEVLGAKTDVVRDLTEEQRVGVLRSGLTDRCTSTFNAAAELLCSGWMRSLKFDPIALLRLLDPAANEALCERAVRTILAAADDADDSGRASIRELSDPEVRAYREAVLEPGGIEVRGGEEEEEDLLDPAAALYLRVLCDATSESRSLSPSERAEALGRMLPDIPVLGEVLKKHLGRLIDLVRTNGEDDTVQDDDKDDEDEADDEAQAAREEAESFVCAQLLKLARSSDLKEEGSRRHFVSVMYDTLSSLETPVDLIEEGIAALLGAHDTEPQFLQTISEIIANVGDDASSGDGGGGDDDHHHPALDAEAAATALRQMRVASILSIVLESTSGHMMGNAVLAGFSSHILPAVVSADARVREVGVGCLGRYALLMGEDQIDAEYAPLLLRVCGNEEECMEVRAQAMLALSDLAMMYDFLVLAPRPPDDAGADGDEAKDEGGPERPPSFPRLLSGLLRHPKPALIIVAAEVAVRLLLAGRLHDPALLAHLVVIFFDRSLSDLSQADDEGEDEVREIGSPVRLQQILSLFFPAYGMKSREGREALIRSLPPLLSLVDERMKAPKAGKGRGGRHSAASAWPVAKMIEFVCSAVDAGARQAEEEDGATAPKTPKKPSSTLLASIAIANFLIQQGPILSDAYTRFLCKILGGANVDGADDDPSVVRDLKKALDHAAAVVTDDRSIKWLDQLMDALGEVESKDEDDEDDSRTEAEEQELVSAMGRTTLDDDEDEPVANVPTNLMNLMDGGDEDVVEVDEAEQSGEANPALPGGGQGAEDDDDDDDFFDGMYGGPDAESTSSEGEAYEEEESDISKENARGGDEPAYSKGEAAPRRSLRNTPARRRRLADLNT